MYLWILDNSIQFDAGIDVCILMHAILLTSKVPKALYKEPIYALKTPDGPKETNVSNLETLVSLAPSGILRTLFPMEPKL